MKKIDTLFMVAAIFAGIFYAIAGLKSKPKKILNIYGGFAIILAGIMSFFVFPAKGKTNDGYLRLCYEAIIFWLILIFITYIKKYYKKKKEKEKEEELKAKKREKIKAREYDDECIRVYELYEDGNYDINNEEVNRIISSSHNIPVEQIKSMYKRGKEAKIIRKKEIMQMRIEVRRKKKIYYLNKKNKILI